MRLLRWLQLGVLCAACTPLMAIAQTAPAPPASSSSAAAAAATSSGTPAAPVPRNEAGKIDLVAGPVTVVGADQKQRTPKKGEKLYEGDSVLTNANGELHAELTDGGVLAVRPNTAMLITKYQANGDASDTSIFGLLKGSIRSITGWIGKANQANYKIVTPTVTIGVRGTDHEPTVIAEGSSEGAAGTYDKVHAGASYIEGANGRVDVPQGRAGFLAAYGRERPRVLDQVPAFFRPARNDARLAGRHERIVQTHEARRAARVKAVQAGRTRAEAQAQRQAKAQGQGQQQAGERQKAQQQRQQRQQDAQKAREQQQKARQEQTKARQDQTKARQEQATARQEQAKARQEQTKARNEQVKAQQKSKGEGADQQRPRQRPQAKETQGTPQQRELHRAQTRANEK